MLKKACLGPKEFSATLHTVTKVKTKMENDERKFLLLTREHLNNNYWASPKWDLSVITLILEIRNCYRPAIDRRSTGDSEVRKLLFLSLVNLHVFLDTCYLNLFKSYYHSIQWWKGLKQKLSRFLRWKYFIWCLCCFFFLIFFIPFTQWMRLN